jgi:hypothetical protein
MVAFYNQRGTAEQWIKEGKCAIKWTRLSCRTFAANAVRLQLHALAYNLRNFLRTLATPEPIRDWSLTSLKEKLIQGRRESRQPRPFVAFQMAEVAIPRKLFEEILRMIAELRPQPIPRRRERRGCHESNEKPRERCVLASPKSTPLGLAAERFGSWRTTLTSPPAKSAETAEKSGFDTGSSGECRVEPVHSILRITRLRMRT